MTGRLSVPDSDARDVKSKPDVIAHRTVRGGTRVPLRLGEDARVTVEVDVEDGSGFSVSVMGLGGMESKHITDMDELVVESDSEDEDIVEVRGDGRARIRVVRG